MAARAFPTASRTQSLSVTTRGSSCSCQEEAEEEEEAGGERNTGFQADPTEQIPSGPESS